MVNLRYDKKTIGDRIRTLRLKSGLTLEELAANIYMAPKSLENIESGERAPSVEALVFIANMFQVSVDSILARESPAYEHIAEKIPFFFQNRLRLVSSKSADTRGSIRTAILDFSEGVDPNALFAAAKTVSSTVQMKMIAEYLPPGPCVSSDGMTSSALF
ncbi:MAG: helix-turn-helix domain-containing protein [Clostridiales bacterium]|jgi:transcriptional regulator with XRE-family HTH domain|nr:helix-turn-helix domain-containing protein [Clostridiales bacterium]